MMTLMMAGVLPLVATADATFTANTGTHNWSAPSAWAGGVVPTADAKIIIPVGAVVTYDMNSTVALDWLRVDGELYADPTQTTHMVINFIATEYGSKWYRGTSPSNPMPEAMPDGIELRNDIALNPAVDTKSLGNGIVTMGEVFWYGAEKTTWDWVAVDPMNGDTTLTLQNIPVNWQIGDELKIGGSRYLGYKYDTSLPGVRLFASECEEVTITAVNGAVITFTPALQFDHDTERPEHKVDVQNHTRSVSCKSSGGDAVAVDRRPHFMNMHNFPDIRYCQFDAMGRTDKTVTALNDYEFSPLTATSNVKGRYPLHLHVNGTDPAQFAILIGNSVNGTPGWGIVTHDSHAMVHWNVVYNAQGAGFMWESGNEIGANGDNSSMLALGNDWSTPKGGDDINNYDNGRTGSAFQWQNRTGRNYRNVASSCNCGIAFFHRGSNSTRMAAGLDSQLPIDRSAFAHPQLLQDDPQLINQVPLMTNIGNITYASNKGFFVQKANPNQNSDFQTIIQDFLAWEVIKGVDIGYTGHYLIKNSHVYGKVQAPQSKALIGFALENNTINFHFVDCTATNFPTGFDLDHVIVNMSVNTPAARQHRLFNSTAINCSVDYKGVGGTDEAEWLTSLDTTTPFSVAVTNGPLVMGVNSHVSQQFLKSDSTGMHVLPVGPDDLDKDNTFMLWHLDTVGYWIDNASGEYYTYIPNYFTDNATGEKFKYHHEVRLDSQVVAQITSGHSGRLNHTNNGSYDRSAAVVDSEMVLDEAMQPLFGRCYVTGPDELTYWPDYEATMVETVKVWRTDKKGHTTEEWVTLDPTGVADFTSKTIDLSSGTPDPSVSLGPIPTTLEWT